MNNIIERISNSVEAVVAIKTLSYDYNSSNSEYSKEVMVDIIKSVLERCIPEVKNVVINSNGSYTVYTNNRTVVLWYAHNTVNYVELGEAA